MIILVPYDPRWVDLFSEEKTQLQRILNDINVRIEHIGSTAIPGINAKPVIDILIGVHSLADFSKNHIKKIESFGYQYKPEFESEFPFRRYFQKTNKNEIRTHQIHLVNFPSAWWEKHILFRDYLRAHENDAKQYELLKLELAQQFTDSIEYARAKTEFCQKIDKLAFHDFAINKPSVSTIRTNGYVPQLACFDEYCLMLENKEFIARYGVAYNKEKIRQRIISDRNHWNQYGFGPWMWYDKENNQYIGRVGLKTFELNHKKEIELTYAIKPDYWGKGIVLEIAKQSLDFAFNCLKLTNLICFTTETNDRSLRVMNKLGFRYENDFIYLGEKYKLHRIDVST